MSLVPQLLSSDVRKPSALVHFERELSPIEQKVMTLIIFHCQVSDKDESGFYYIKKSFIREFVGWEESNNYPRIYEAFESIFDNSIRWNFLGADRTFESLKCKLIVSLLEPNKTGQYIGFQLHHALEPLIRDPKVFARLKLIMMALLTKPKYSYPLYELIADCYSRGQRTVKISLQLLKDYLGIPNESYIVFKDFKNRVLKPSIDGINKCSDYSVSYKTYRNGRLIDGITFHIRQQSWQPPLLLGPLQELQRYSEKTTDNQLLERKVELTAEEKAFVDSVMPYQISEADALQVLDIHGLEGGIEIRDYVLQEVSRRNGKKDQVRDIGAYMARCFREGFGKRTAAEREQSQRRRTAHEIKRKQEEARGKVQAEVEQLKKDFHDYQKMLVDEQLATLTPEDRTILDKTFMATDRLWRAKYQESGIESPMVRSAFYHFAIGKLLTNEQTDIVAFARNRGASLHAINLLQIA